MKKTFQVFHLKLLCLCSSTLLYHGKCVNSFFNIIVFFSKLSINNLLISCVFDIKKTKIHHHTWVGWHPSSESYKVLSSLFFFFGLWSRVLKPRQVRRVNPRPSPPGQTRVRPDQFIYIYIYIYIYWQSLNDVVLTF